jgi:hypothetical protein
MNPYLIREPLTTTAAELKDYTRAIVRSRGEYELVKARAARAACVVDDCKAISLEQRRGRCVFHA